MVHCSTSSAQLCSQFFSLCFFQLCNASHGFRTQDVPAPVTTDLESYLIISVIVVRLDSLHQLCKGSLILPVDDSFSSFRA
uniref:Secreted protein n=1 Tax=Ficedula albicollis TaxID=59894 RepID=A0A803V0V0_FICAL